jgi:hypothetical protein
MRCITSYTIELSIALLPTAQKLSIEYGGRVRLLLGFMPTVFLSNPEDIEVDRNPIHNYIINTFNITLQLNVHLIIKCRKFYLHHNTYTKEIFTAFSKNTWAPEFSQMMVISSVLSRNKLFIQNWSHSVNTTT